MAPAWSQNQATVMAAMCTSTLFFADGHKTLRWPVGKHSFSCASALQSDSCAAYCGMCHCCLPSSSFVSGSSEKWPAFWCISAGLHVLLKCCGSSTLWAQVSPYAGVHLPTSHWILSLRSCQFSSVLLSSLAWQHQQRHLANLVIVNQVECKSLCKLATPHRVYNSQFQLNCL